MNRIKTTLDGLGSGLILAVRAFASLPSAPRILKRVAEQAYSAGYASLPIVTILCFFIGAVLALQSGISMRTSAPNNSSARWSEPRWPASSGP
jgi:phospholipid/cholesterol/gamma-HCH transport system permease protein